MRPFVDGRHSSLNSFAGCAAEELALLGFPAGMLISKSPVATMAAPHQLLSKSMVTTLTDQFSQRRMVRDRAKQPPITQPYAHTGLVVRIP